MGKQNPAQSECHIHQRRHMDVNCGDSFVCTQCGTRVYVDQQESTMPPIVLLDQPEDQQAETLGWVETTVNEDAARMALAEFCYGEDGETGYLPKGPATRVWLQPASDEQWTSATPNDDEAREFWQVVVD